MISKFFLHHSLCLQPRPSLNLAPPGRGTNALALALASTPAFPPIDIDPLSYVLPFLYIHLLSDDLSYSRLSQRLGSEIQKAGQFQLKRNTSV